MDAHNSTAPPVARFQGGAAVWVMGKRGDGCFLGASITRTSPAPTATPPPTRPRRRKGLAVAVYFDWNSKSQCPKAVEFQPLLPGPFS